MHCGQHLPQTDELALYKKNWLTICDYVNICFSSNLQCSHLLISVLVNDSILFNELLIIFKSYFVEVSYFDNLIETYRIFVRIVQRTLK